MGKREMAAVAMHRATVSRFGPEPVAIRVQRPRGVVVYLCRDGRHWHSTRSLALKCSERRNDD